jgi:mono/diheme cytochrome c family protein
MKIIKLILLVVTITAFLIACAKSTTENKPVEKANVNTAANVKPTATVDEMAAAQTIYKEKCSKCHKEDGTGGEVEIDGEKLKAENFTSEKMKKMDDEKYIKYTAKGVKDEGMPAFENILSESEIKDVVKFIRAKFQN